MKLPKFLTSPAGLATVVGVVGVAVVLAVRFAPGSNGGMGAEPGGKSASSLNLTDADKTAMSNYGYAVIDHHFNANGPEPTPPPMKLGGNDYDQLFATLLSHGKIRCSWGAGHGNAKNPNRLALDVKQAVTKCLNDKRFGGVFKQSEAADVDLVFNFLHNKLRVAKNDLKYQKAKIELGVHALELKAGSKRAFFKESVAISKNYNHDRLLERLCKKAKQDKDCAQTDKITLYKYETTTFKSNRQAVHQELFRYHPLVRPTDVTMSSVRDALDISGDWFLNNRDQKTGILEYMYLPSYDKYSKKNNDVRQLGALWSMTENDLFFKKDRFNKVLEATFAHYFQYLTREGQKVAPEAIQPQDNAQIRIGRNHTIAFNAFAIFSLVNAKYYLNRNNLMRGLGNAIVAQQRDDGSYRTYHDSEKKGGEDFYPGEAMLSLMMLYQETKDEKYLNSVKKAFPFYRDYWRKNKNTPFVPWHTRTDRILYEVTKDEEIAEFIFEMQDWIWRQQIQEHRYPDVIGGIGSRVPTMSSCTHAEGLGDAYMVAKQVGDKKHEEDYAKRLKLVGRFILQLQYNDENTFYLKNPKRAIGGFRASLVDNSQRNDYTQHCSLALIKLAESGLLQ